MIRISS